MHGVGRLVGAVEQQPAVRAVVGDERGPPGGVGRDRRVADLVDERAERLPRVTGEHERRREHARRRGRVDVEVDDALRRRAR